MSTNLSKLKECVILCAGANQPYLEAVNQLVADYERVFFVGVDRGALKLIQAGYDLDFSVGDFDSVTQDEFDQIEAHSNSTQQFSSEKDDTDLELALELAVKKYPKADYYLFGAIGEGFGRLDHLLANVWLVFQPRYQAVVDRLYFVESHHRLCFYLPGTHELFALPDKEYLSIVSLTAIKQLVIKGSKYELQATDFAYPRALISNEFIGKKSAEISFEEGLLMVLWVKEHQQI